MSSGPIDLEKQTPMMRQYLGVKAQYPHAIILVRMGDFFEAFYEDAETVARLLDLTLTARAKEKDPIPMAGVPHHAAEGYVARLIALGRTVVMVDQVEDPKKAKGLVRREVTRILTPGTFVDPEAPPRGTSHLAALARAPGKRLELGLAALDVATGTFRATQAEQLEVVVDELARLEARELLVASSWRDDPATAPLLAQLAVALPSLTLTFLEADEAAPGPARAALVARLGAEEVQALEPLLRAEALTAAGMALAFAERTQLAQASLERAAGGHLGHIAELKPYAASDALVIDHEARTHLELFRSAGAAGRKGTLIGALDEAVTSMGGRLLAEWLARPLLDPATISARQDAIAALVARPTALDGLRAALREVHDLERLLGRVVMGRSGPRDLAALRVSLGRAPEALRAAADTPSALLGRLAQTDVVDDVRAVLAQALVEAPSTALGEGRVFQDGHDAELDRLVALSERGKEVLLDIERRERERTGISSLKIRFNRVFGYYIEITKANLKSVPSDYIRKQTTAGGERYYTEELKTYEEQILSADELRLARETTLFRELVARVAADAARLHQLAVAVATLDTLAALAFVAERRGWTRPVVEASERIDIKDGRHPVLETLSAELGEPFVPNDVALGPSEDGAVDARVLVVTGPNMAGKSTIMRQTALIVILAQVGAFVPARHARIGLVDRVFTRVGASDDLSRGRSTFMVEMAETARILRSATARSLIVLDEIGRGTSTFDGLAIAWSVAEHLHDVIGARTMFATHYHELTELCRDKPRVVNAHVAVREWNDQIVFLRKLLPGPTSHSYGVQVARLAGLPKPVVDRARAVLAALEAQELRAGDGTLVDARRGRGKTAQLHLFAGAARRVVPPAEAPATAHGGDSPSAAALEAVGAPTPTPTGAAPTATPAQAAVLAELAQLDLDDLSPRQAHLRLAELQARLRAP